MLIKNISCRHNRVDKIYHVADIHIRNVKRHDEYNEVLNRFYESVRKGGTDNSIIIIAGDLAHSKLETSPELSKEIAELLTKCSELTDTIIIPGNHDCNLNNKQRLDVISPIVDYIDNDQIHYLKDNGVYKMKNILFSHFGIFSDVEEWNTYKKIPKIYKDQTDTHIALYHGPIHKSITDSNYEVSNVSVQPYLFDGFDIGILGDIHKQQTIFIEKIRQHVVPDGWTQDPEDENSIIKDFPILRYPGSLIQQNHSEKIDGHGYTVWNVTDRSYEHVELNNDYGFFTAEVKNGKLTSDITDIPIKSRLRFRCFETEPVEIKKILEELKRSHDIQEVSYIRGDENRESDRGNIDKVSLQKLNDHHFQNRLIKDYIQIHKPKTPKKVVRKIFELNQLINSKIPPEDKSPNIIWKPKVFKFDNMFSYGENNIVDFSKITGISGIFGPNASGKSSIFSALCFCLFDKCDRTYKASHIMNEAKMSFKCELNFEIDNVDYFVKRTAKRDKKGSVRVEVDFYKIVGGEKVILNDESRRSTNEVIRSYIGSFDDFVLTSLSPQKNQNTNFAEKGQTERKDLITKFLGIDIFDSIHQIALEESKETTSKMKNFDYEQINDDIELWTGEVDQLNSDYIKMGEMKNSIVDDHNKILREIIKKGLGIRKIAGISESIDTLETNLETLNKKREQIDIDLVKKELSDLQLEIDSKKTEILTVESSSLLTDYNKFVTDKEELSTVQSEIEILKLDVTNKLKKVGFLDGHKYDEDCECCMQNVFVQDALNAKIELDELKPLVDKLISRKEDLKQKSLDRSHLETEYNKYLTLKQLVSKLSNQLNISQKRFIDVKSKDIKLIEQIKNCEDKIEKYYESIDVAKKNEELESEIKILHDDERDLASKIEIANEKMSDVFSDIKVKTTYIIDHKQKLKDIADLELENKAYQIYIEAIHRDGVPYDIISKSVPAIEKEVNEILSQIVEFGILLDLDGKNINANLVYTDRMWPIEMGSGMESFISNLAIRIALSNISNMPTSNFLAIDEGFGALDDEIFSTIPALFSFLRNSFDFILIISHIVHVKDFVDTQIEIKSENGFSQVRLD